MYKTRQAIENKNSYECYDYSPDCQGKKNLDKMLILTSGQVFHALKTVSLLVTASGIIGATKVRPNFKNNCNAQTKKKNHFAGKWR